MEIYLTIITTVLVLTQIIRICQNHIQLHRQNVLYKKQLGDLVEYEIQKEDIDNQRKANRLLITFLEREEYKWRNNVK